MHGAINRKGMISKTLQKANLRIASTAVTNTMHVCGQTEATFAEAKKAHLIELFFLKRTCLC